MLARITSSDSQSRYAPSAVSIITPVLNGRPFLESCLANVASQGSCVHEHIVIDGGSDDGTDLLVVKLQAQYPRVRLIRQKSRGQAAAMNEAIREARCRI